MCVTLVEFHQLEVQVGTAAATKHLDCQNLPVSHTHEASATARCMPHSACSCHSHDIFRLSKDWGMLDRRMLVKQMSSLDQRCINCQPLHVSHLHCMVCLCTISLSVMPQAGSFGRWHIMRVARVLKLKMLMSIVQAHSTCCQCADESASRRSLKAAYLRLLAVSLDLSMDICTM